MADGEALPRAAFTAMTAGGADDWALIMARGKTHVRQLPDRLMAHLELLRGDDGGFAVDRLEHSLQTATRAHRAGEDEEYVVCALLHDMGDVLGPTQHAEIAAVVLKPYVSEANHWMVQQHGVFQGYYFFHHIGLDRDMREQFRGHPQFERTAQFCHLYDQNSFEPGFDTMPLEAFTPMMQRVLSRPKTTMYRTEKA